ncbi:hypothetical protein HYH03_000435 [Edaphochlamys debaryana]|uniref:Uncharacterized protein n=1 Tax=Edaphochlamys debaryana TaxID=47281 RepID=A0A835YHH4_9CHLO|nr:hypothetical protein HYH03_000435 [Edaphochlamys debaryana]|eukprot:KAG2501937.1 hypothetical protein HYH03_000435 [Edaphochlamys debaryana]
MATAGANVHIYELLQDVPLEFHPRIVAPFYAQQQQVTALALELAHKSDLLRTKDRELVDTEKQLILALAGANVRNIRSFLEYLLKQWAKEVTLTEEDMKRKRWAIFKKGLMRRRELVQCLQENVSSWVLPNMTPNQAVGNMAANLEAIMEDASNGIHSFDKSTGFTLLKTPYNGPTVAALACLAKSVKVPCRIIVQVDSSIGDGDNATST